MSGCTRNGRTLNGPEWLLEFRSTRDVTVDSCIADVVTGLWERGFVTLGSCCGHDETPPSLVVGEHESVPEIRSAIADMDDRGWDLFQWRLVRDAAAPPDGRQEL